jgi:hypothetical protein
LDEIEFWKVSTTFGGKTPLKAIHHARKGSGIQGHRAIYHFEFTDWGCQPGICPIFRIRSILPHPAITSANCRKTPSFLKRRGNGLRWREIAKSFRTWPPFPQNWD